jgi:hypothetical protein
MSILCIDFFMILNKIVNWKPSHSSVLTLEDLIGFTIEIQMIWDSSNILVEEYTFVDVS